MSPPVRLFYVYLLCAGVAAFLVEAALEYRHYRMGYDTPIFGIKPKEAPTQQHDQPSEAVIHTPYRFGPTDNFPFKSRVITPEKNGETRIWLASASHAEGGRLPAEAVFPNKICDNLDITGGCEVINASKAGMTIDGNIELLHKHAPKYLPDYAVLYQLSMSILRMPVSLFPQAPEGVGDASEDEPQRGIFDFSGITKSMQKLSLYVHLSDYIGGNIKLMTLLKDDMPAEMDRVYEKQVLDFIKACRAVGIKPVISTFAASHNAENLHKMHFSLRTNFVRNDPYLSPVGWVNTVKRYNTLLRKLARREQVPLIDIEKHMHGEYRYFIDFVHFNEKGHEEVAGLLARDLQGILAKERIEL